MRESGIRVSIGEGNKMEIKWYGPHHSAPEDLTAHSLIRSGEWYNLHEINCLELLRVYWLLFWTGNWKIMHLAFLTLANGSL